MRQVVDKLIVNHRANQHQALGRCLVGSGLVLDLCAKWDQTFGAVLIFGQWLKCIQEKAFSRKIGSESAQLSGLFFLKHGPPTCTNAQSWGERLFAGHLVQYPKLKRCHVSYNSMKFDDDSRIALRAGFCFVHTSWLVTVGHRWSNCLVWINCFVSSGQKTAERWHRSQWKG